MRRRRHLFIALPVFVLFVCFGSGKSGADEKKRGFFCRPIGRDYACVAFGVDTPILPLWIIHTKPEWRSYGMDSGQLHAPKHPTIIEMRLYYGEDQDDAPYDAVVYRQYRGWVRLCKGRAVLDVYTDGVEMKKCP